MKKLLSILTLLLCVCSGAWGEDFSISPIKGSYLSPGNLVKVTYSGDLKTSSTQIQTTSSNKSGSFTVTATAPNMYIKSVTFTDANNGTNKQATITKTAGNGSLANSSGTYTYTGKEGDGDLTISVAATSSGAAKLGDVSIVVSNVAENDIVTMSGFSKTGDIISASTVTCNGSNVSAPINMESSQWTITSTNISAPSSNDTKTITITAADGKVLKYIAFLDSECRLALAEMSSTGGTVDGASWTTSSTPTMSVTFKNGISTSLTITKIFVITETPTPTLTGAWSAASGTIFEGDAVPTPTFSVSASNSAALTGSEYSVAYSVKEGSNDGLITITGEGAGFTLNNDATGTATLVATLTSANESNYTTPTTNTYEYIYTVNAKVPTYTLNKDDHDISLRSTPVHRAADTNETATVTMEAGFLTGTSGTVTFVGDAVDGLSVSPAVFTITDGSVAETEFTITYNSASGTSGTATLRFSDGTTTKDLLVDYVSVVAHAQRVVSSAETWNWAGTTSVNIPETPENSAPVTTSYGISRSSVDVNLADFDGEVFDDNAKLPAGFDALLASNFQNPSNGSAYQGTTLKFKTTVPGTLAVDFSNTGGSTRPNRYLYVNGIQTSFKSANTTKVNAIDIAVPAGEVIIKGVMDPESDDSKAGTDQYLRFYKIVFTPLNGTTDVDVVKVTDVNYATYVTKDAIDFTKTAEVQAYKVTSTADAIEYEEVEAAPAGTPLLIKAKSSSYVLKAADSTPAVVTGNLLQSSTGSTVGDGSTIYVLGNNGGTAVWGKLKNGKTLSAGKAYLVITGGGAKEFYDIIIGGDGETTAIDHVSTPRFNSDAAIYNLSGQKVTESYKGIVIVNGKKYINK